MPEVTGKEQEIPRLPDGTFPKGTSGNPAGRPKGILSWSTAIMREAEKQAGTLPDGTKITKIDLVARKLWELAIAGDIRAIEELGNRVDGRPKQAVDVTTNGKDMPTPIVAINRDVPTNPSVRQD